MSAALLTKRQAILPGSLQLSPKRRCKIRHFCLQISGICTCKKHEFCELNNISRNQYYYWLRKLKEHTLERSGFTFVELDEPVEPEAAPIDAAMSNDIVVSLGDACITVKEGVSRHLLEMVVRVIRNAE